MTEQELTQITNTLKEQVEQVKGCALVIASVPTGRENNEHCVAGAVTGKTKNMLRALLSSMQADPTLAELITGASTIYEITGGVSMHVQEKQ